MTSITPNILELLGAFFLGCVITLMTIWTMFIWSDDQDDEEPPTEKPA